MLKVFIFFLLPIISFAQLKDLKGIVVSNSNILLESANIIAKPLQDKSSIKFAITDSKGCYHLILDNDTDYEIVVSYIGFVDKVLILQSDSNISTYNFVLESNGEKLREIVIKHEYKAIEIKKDTLIYNVKSFANGNERKMKEILEKLPGVEVDKDGVITVQGKRVTQMQVEGKSFFGGGSKLAVENIPADALEKIEVIDNFNEVGFLKKVSDSEDLAINVKLKEDKKKFIFGDIEGGLGIGTDKSNLLHAGLFYYAPRLNISFIGDANNIGRSTFTPADFRRFTNGSTKYITKRKPTDNLYSLTKSNTDFVENKTQFEALNISYDFSPKFNISVFSIFSKIWSISKNITQNEYLENQAQTFEYKTEEGRNLIDQNLTNLKLQYVPNNNQKWLYNAQFQSESKDSNNIINSTVNSDSNIFKETNQGNTKSFKQYLEWHKNFNLNHIQTLAFNQSYDDNSPKNQWLTDRPFFNGLIPLQQQQDYTVEQLKRLKTNLIDGVFKHYWIINSYNHLYINFGNTFENTYFETSEKQLLSNNLINDFSKADFNNKTNYVYSDIYTGFEYKFKIGKWTNKAGLYYHWYNLMTNQINGNYGFSSKMFQPQWNSEFEFNDSEKIVFNYKLEANFPEVQLMSNGYTLQKYNLVYKGNELLKNGKFHSFNLFYSKMNAYRGLMWNGFLNYTKRTENIRNQVVIEGINQYNSPFLSRDPENSILFNSSISKKIYRFELRLNTNLNWLSYYQTLNNEKTLNNRNNQVLALTFKTIYKEWPNISLGYEKGYSHFSGLTVSRYESDALKSNLEITFLKSWIYKVDYQNLRNTNSNQQSDFYQITNTSLRYQKKNNPFSFELICNNLFNIERKNSYMFSDYMISQQAINVMPRVLMFSLTYKL